jgi:hypothetical protein
MIFSIIEKQMDALQFNLQTSSLILMELELYIVLQVSAKMIINFVLKRN